MLRIILGTCIVFFAASCSDNDASWLAVLPILAVGLPLALSGAIDLITRVES